MTKAEIIRLLMERSGLPRREAAQCVQVFLDSVKTGLHQEGKVSLVGFGTFLVKAKNSRNGRNPRTGEVIRIPPKNVAVFRPGKSFRSEVNHTGVTAKTETASSS